MRNDRAFWIDKNAKNWMLEQRNYNKDKEKLKKTSQTIFDEYFEQNKYGLRTCLLNEREYWTEEQAFASLLHKYY